MKYFKGTGAPAASDRVDIAPDTWYAYQPAHSLSCADAELVAGVWTCGIRRLECGCVVYAFSHTDHAFADEVETTTGCEVLRFGTAAHSVWNGTLAADGVDTVAEKIATGGGERDPLVNEYALTPATMTQTGRRLKARTIQSIMNEHGHSRLDLLYLNLRGGEFAVLDSLEKTGFPPIGQLALHLTMTELPPIERAFSTLWAAGFRDYRSTLALSISQQFSFLGPTGVAPASDPHDVEVMAARLQALVNTRAQGASISSPVWSCDESLLGLFGDGTKWACAMPELAAKSVASKCVVYSFGGKDNTMFEHAI
eukprot:scaffold47756_cov376-Isochrysis_galbana.AAC.1